MKLMPLVPMENSVECQKGGVDLHNTLPAPCGIDTLFFPGVGGGRGVCVWGGRGGTNHCCIREGAPSLYQEINF